MVQAAGENQSAPGSDASSDAQSLSSRAERDTPAGTGGRASDDGLYCLAEERAACGAVELKEKAFERRSKDSRWWLSKHALFLVITDYSETLCSSFCARRTRSTEYGARRLGS